MDPPQAESENFAEAQRASPGRASGAHENKSWHTLIFTLIFYLDNTGISSILNKLKEKV